VTVTDEEYLKTCWYRTHFKNSPLNDEQVLTLRVLERVNGLYNWDIVGRSRPDGGFQSWGNGVLVKVRYARLGTFDSDWLTRLVIAAHEYAVRMEIGATSNGNLPGGMAITLYQRAHDGDSFYSRHPDLKELIGLCQQRLDAVTPHV
jgi:hypothetical protein